MKERCTCGINWHQHPLSPISLFFLLSHYLFLLFGLPPAASAWLISTRQLISEQLGCFPPQPLFIIFSLPLLGVLRNVVVWVPYLRLLFQNAAISLILTFPCFFLSFPPHPPHSCPSFQDLDNILSPEPQTQFHLGR